MKLIQQKTLYFQEGTSDKIYEVDLCEVSKDQYLVNFRYGRRGTPLKEGTKTALPVELEAAKIIYDKLVASKTKKGYLSSTSPSVKINDDSDNTIADDADPQSIAEDENYIPPVPTNEPLNPDRVNGILEGLRLAMEQSTTRLPQFKKIEPKDETAKSFWNIVKDFTSGSPQKPNTGNHPIKKTKPSRPLSRLLWRVGELRLKEALSLLLKVDVSNDPMEQYSLVWALGRIGDPAGLDQIQKTVKKSNFDALHVVAREARMILLSADAKREMVINLLTKLPTDFFASIQEDDEDTLIEEIEKELAQKANIYWSISYLYLISEEYPVVRRALLKWTKQAPLKGSGYFQAFRQLFKSAEFRDDGQLYGIIAHRIIQTRAMVNHIKWGGIHIDGKWISKSKEIKKANSQIGFTDKSKAYFHRRVWRTFDRRATVGDLSYIKMAVGFLLTYQDGDGQAAYKKSFWSYEQMNGRWESIRRDVDYPAFASEVAFNHILYKNSTRYRLANGRKQYVVVSDVSSKEDFSMTREEAYPELWDKMPQGLMHLLAESNCIPVQEFACKAARDNHQMIGRMADVSFICLLLEKPYECTTRYGIDLARIKYNPKRPDFELTIALLKSNLEAARQLGLEWLGSSKAIYFNATDFISDALFTSYSEIKEWFDQALSTASFNDTKAESVVAKSIAKMLAFAGEYTPQDQLSVLNAGDLLKQHFQKQLYEIDLSFVNNLLDHPLSAIKVFGAKILLNHRTEVKDLPEELILKLIEGESTELRAVGVQLLGKLPQADLVKKEDLLTRLCVSKHAEIRKEVHPIVIDLAKENRGFGDQIVSRLAAVLLKKETAEGRDKDLLELLLNHLINHLDKINKKLTLNLLYSSRKTANELGSHLLQTYIDPKDLSILQIVLLASNEIVAIRRWVWETYKNNVSRIKYEAAEAVRIMDAKWDDSRDFAFNFFDTHFGDKEWTPEILISLCDSNNPLVQQYGKSRITKYFRKEDGERYLLQLSQHPSSELQNFASNYLDEFAKNNPAHIDKLRHYFTTVLSNINKSKVAKKRIFEFLKREGLKDKSAATIIAEIMTRQSATMAINDKAKCIEIMRDLQAVYPDLQLPIRIKPINIYTKTS